MGSSVGDVVQGYATLASSLLERWSAYTAEVAARVDATGYDTEDAVADLAAWASLAAESGFLLAAEGFDAVAGFTSWQAGQNVVTSQPFQAPAGAALKLAGPLVKGGGLDALPVSVVSIQPPQLADGKTEFTLAANAAGHRGATYFGIVEASAGAPANLTSAPAAPVNVTVWITVP